MKKIIAALLAAPTFAIAASAAINNNVDVSPISRDGDSICDYLTCGEHSYANVQILDVFRPDPTISPNWTLKVEGGFAVMINGDAATSAGIDGFLHAGLVLSSIQFRGGINQPRYLIGDVTEICVTADICVGASTVAAAR